MRAHENAHRAAAGGLVVSGPSYNFQRGPDGKAYAVGGEVKISTVKGRTPEQTISSARQAQHAALAPHQPSRQDRAVAARAGQRIQQAQIELAELKAADRTEKIANPEKTEPEQTGPEQTETVEPTEQSAEKFSNVKTAQGSKDLDNNHQRLIQHSLDVVA